MIELCWESYIEADEASLDEVSRREESMRDNIRGWRQTQRSWNRANENLGQTDENNQMKAFERKTE